MYYLILNPMTKNILAFGASTSSQSINRKLAAYTAQQVSDAKVNLIDLNDFEMPIYSFDREKESGIPELAKAFKQQIADADGIIISYAEHNGSYSAAYKNIYDWASRIERSVWMSKPLFLMSTSPGARGGISVLELAKRSAPFMGGEVVASFSLPTFNQNFSPDSGISDANLNRQWQEQLQAFEASLSK